jgi:chemotaxis protein CheZ
MASESGDSEDLEALFDSIAGVPAEEKPAEKQSAAATTQPAAAPKSDAKITPSAEGGEGGVHTHLGLLTRQLHDSLRELGYEKSLEHAVGKMPDARDRLNYISTLTEQAAAKTLTAVEETKPLQETLEKNAAQLSGRWQQLLDNKLDVDGFKTLVHETRDYLLEVPFKTKTTNAHLMDIVMAQDFQDLTGQVLKKLAETVQQLESQLLTLLIESIPEDKRKGIDDSLLNGPVVNAEGRSDVVTTQAQVDDLLSSLGF